MKICQTLCQQFIFAKATTWYELIWENNTKRLGSIVPILGT